jgi:hypothetical protein
MAKPVIIVRTLVQAEAALAAAAEAGRAIVLASPPGGALSAGAAFYDALAREAAVRHPAARFTLRVDCADDTGAAMGALRIGISEISCRAPRASKERLAALARRHNAQLAPMTARTWRDSLDLQGVGDPLEACRERLARRRQTRNARTRGRD